MKTCRLCQTISEDSSDQCDKCGMSLSQAKTPKSPRDNEDSTTAAMVAGILLLAAGLVIAAIVGPRPTANMAANAAPATTPSPSLPPPAPQSPWEVSQSHNELTGEVRLIATTGSLILRLEHGKLDLYFDTDKFLETAANLDTRMSAVRYKFDEGRIVEQEWQISNNNTALFYPGNPRSFIQKMRRAKRLIIEYKPADLVPQTTAFDVSQFPEEVATALHLTPNQGSNSQ